MGEGQDGGEDSKESLLVWTTTPWTLTANAAAAVHPEKTYIKVRQDGEILYLIKECEPVLKGEYEVLGEVPASELVGARYRAPFAELTAQQGVGAPRGRVGGGQRVRGHGHRAYRARRR